jgi:hypothetical protein
LELYHETVVLLDEQGVAEEQAESVAREVMVAFVGAINELED